MSEKGSQEVETVFLLGRRKAHRELVRAELGEGLGHFRQAASHAADGVSAKMGPRVTAARGYAGPAARKGWESTMVTVAPVAMAALGGARQAGAFAARKATGAKAAPKSAKEMRKKKSARRPRLLTLLAAGTAVGAAAAYALRRRNQPRWDEYDPGQALDAVRSDATSSAPSDLPATPAGSTIESPKQAAAPGTEPSGITFTDTTSPTNRA
jgi:hypothetical protein